MAHWEQPGESDEYYTPKYIFDALEATFDMDVAAPIDHTYIHVPAKEFITRDSLDLEWNGFIWMNPPFGKRNGLIPWLDKFFQHANGIALVPDRTSAPWWQDAASKSQRILFVKGKIKFIKPNGTIGEQPSTGTTLMAVGEKENAALAIAELNGLGIVR